MRIPYDSCPPNCPEFSATFGAFANLFNIGVLGVDVVLSPNVQTFSARVPCVNAGFNARVCSAAPPSPARRSLHRLFVLDWQMQLKLSGDISKKEFSAYVSLTLSLEVRR